MATGKHQQKTTIRSRFQGSFVTVSLILLTCAFLWSSLGLSRVSAWMSQLILSVTLILLLVQLARELLEHEEPDRDGGTHDFFAILQVLMWIALVLVLIWLMGISIGAGLFCLAYLRFYAGERWLLAGCFALGLGLGVQLFFGTLMRVSLYQGVVLGLLAN